MCHAATAPSFLLRPGVTRSDLKGPIVGLAWARARVRKNESRRTVIVIDGHEMLVQMPGKPTDHEQRIETGLADLEDETEIMVQWTGWGDKPYDTAYVADVEFPS